MKLDQTFPARLPELRRLHETGRLNMADIGNVLGLEPMDAARQISVAVAGDVYCDGSQVMCIGDMVEPLPETAEHAYRRGYVHAVQHIRYAYPKPELIAFYGRVQKWEDDIANVQQPTRTHPPVL